MKRIFLSTSLALALSTSLALAQQPAEAPAPTITAHHHAHNPQREVARLSKKLNLSSDQTAKLEPILADRDQKITALRNDTSMTPMVRKQQMRAIRKDTKQRLATILTPDQFQQMKSFHHNHGTPTQPQPNPQAGF